MSQDHLRTVVDEFSAQAALWAGPVPVGLVAQMARLSFKPTDHVVDVAAGSCRVSRAIAPLVATVAAVEITEAMLAKGRQMAAQEGLSTLTFHHGSAESLPFGAETFNTAITRYSFHHFVDAKAVFREMVRTTVLGGRVIVIDILTPEDDALAQSYNSHQQLRDPSHTSSPRLPQLKQWFEDEGMRVQGHIANETQALDDWLNLPNLSEATKAQIRANVHSELEGGPPTGLRPFLDEQTIRFREQVVTLVGEKDAQSS